MYVIIAHVLFLFYCDTNDTWLILTAIVLCLVRSFSLPQKTHENVKLKIYTFKRRKSFNKKTKTFWDFKIIIFNIKIILINKNVKYILYVHSKLTKDFFLFYTQILYILHLTLVLYYRVRVTRGLSNDATPPHELQKLI